MNFLIALLTITTSASAPLLFDSNAILDVRLAGPVSTLLRKRKNHPELPFVLTVNGVDREIQVRLRGNSRLRVCRFPPLRLNFSSHDTDQTIFQGQDKLKLVTHCRSGSAAQVDALQEYAAYRIFNLISDISYRVRLLRITYTDIDGSKKSPIQYAFIIESEAGMAQRLGGTTAKVSGVVLSSLNEDQLASLYLFQYLIGNTDWSLATASDDDACCHNGKIIDLGSQRYYVPYDFDLAGLVNAKYAFPDPKLRIRKVTQRLYRGFCMPGSTLQRALPALSDKEINSSMKYLGQFFTRAEDEQKLLAHFSRYCR